MQFTSGTSLGPRSKKGIPSKKYGNESVDKNNKNKLEKLIKSAKKKVINNTRHIRQNKVRKATRRKKQSEIEIARKNTDNKNFLWSIGDRYHDWWPANRGDIQSYKKCGDFKFLPHMIHYIIICESIRAFEKHYSTKISLTLQNTPLLQNSQPQDVKILSDFANITLPDMSVSKIEESILKKYTQGNTPREFTVSKALFGESDTSKANALATYIKICKHIFGNNIENEYFGVVCDAGFSPFCKLFKHIIENIIKPENMSENIIKQKCTEHHIPLMYMIHTPQTVADSAFTQSFIDCLTVYEFPVNSGDRFECQFNYFADKYKIIFEQNGPFDKNHNFNYKLRDNFINNPQEFTIPYGLRDISSSSSSSSSSFSNRIYRNVGPSLYDLMLYYIHLNSKSSDSIFNYSIYNNNTHALSFNQLQFPEYTYENDEDDQLINQSAPVSENIKIVDRLPNIYKLVDHALGIVDNPTLNNPTLNSSSLMTYKPTHPNSLIKIDGFKELPPKIMIDIKHEGDASQVVAAKIINEKGRFKDRIVFISQDRPCVAHSVSKGLRTIQYGSNYINVYNSRPVNEEMEQNANEENANEEKMEQNTNMGGGGENSGECEVELLEITDVDVKELMLSIGMYADRYLETYITQKNKTINDVLHRRVLHDFYDYTCNMYDTYNRDLEDDINSTHNDTKKFMNILSKIHYKEIVDSLKELINLSNIYNSNFKQPTKTFQKYTSHFSQNKMNLKNTQNVLNKMINQQQNELNYYKNLKTQKNKNKYNKIIQQITNHIRNTRKKINSRSGVNILHMQNQRKLVVAS